MLEMPRPKIASLACAEELKSRWCREIARLERDQRRKIRGLGQRGYPRSMVEIGTVGIESGLLKCSNRVCLSREQGQQSKVDGITRGELYQKRMPAVADAAGDQIVQCRSFASIERCTMKVCWWFLCFADADAGAEAMTIARQ